MLPVGTALYLNTFTHWWPQGPIPLLYNSPQQFSITVPVSQTCFGFLAPCVLHVSFYFTKANARPNKNQEAFLNCLTFCSVTGNTILKLAILVSFAA